MCCVCRGSGFSHMLTAYKIVGHFFGRSYLHDFFSNIQVENTFFRISSILVPCPHAQLRGLTVIKNVWTFFRPWGRDCSQSPLCWFFSGMANTSIHGLGEDDTANSHHVQCGWQLAVVKVTSLVKSKQLLLFAFDTQQRQAAVTAYFSS